MTAKKIRSLYWSINPNKVIQLQFRVNAACVDDESMQCHSTTSGLLHIFVYCVARNDVVPETEHGSGCSILGSGTAVRSDTLWALDLELDKQYREEVRTNLE